MRGVLLVVAALVVLVPPGIGHTGSGTIMLYGDAGFTACNLVDPVGLLTIFVVYEFHSGASGVRYAVSENTEGALAYLADVNNFALVTGGSQSGITVSFGGCIQNAIHIQNVLYSVVSSPPVCTMVEVVPDPAAASGQVESVDCSATTRFTGGWFATFNGDGSCPCGMICCPTETGTWGRVKGLYR